LTTPIEVILFDVFGTVVDWRYSMSREFKHWFKLKEIEHIDVESCVLFWVTAYSNNMRKISQGERRFDLVDNLNKESLITTLQHYQIDNKFNQSEIDELWRIWRRLTPWPDSLTGVKLLKQYFTIGALSNGNIALLKDLSENIGISWDVILSGEQFKCYKPNSKVYLQAASSLKLNPEQILLIASHKYDLKAAQKCGFRTAYLFRPEEFQSVTEEQHPKEDEFDFNLSELDADFISTLSDQNSHNQYK